MQRLLLIAAHRKEEAINALFAFRVIFEKIKPDLFFLKFLHPNLAIEIKKSKIEKPILSTKIERKLSVSKSCEMYKKSVK